MTTPALDDTKTRAPQAAAHYLGAAIAAIDAALGPGYAAANPALVAAMVQASAIESAVNAARAASHATNDTLLKLKPRLFG